MAKPVHVVAVAFVHRDDRWLVPRRRKDAHLGGYWEFPGGKRRAAETATTTGLRELREECAVVATPERVLAMLAWEYEDRIVQLTPVVCRWDTGEPRPLGCEACGWLPRGQLAELRMPPINAEAIRGLGPPS